MSKEELIIASVSAAMNNFVSTQCDILLENIKSKFINQVTELINTAKSEICKELVKKTSEMTQQLMATPRDNFIDTAVSCVPHSGESKALSREQYLSDVTSAKHNSSAHSEMEASVQSRNFSYTSSYLKKQRRRGKQDKLSSTSVPASVVDSSNAKSKYTWGKSLDNTVGFSGAVPDLFIYRCDLNTESMAIKDHLIKSGIGVKNIEMKSSKEAPTRSFKVSVATLDDFHKVLSGNHIPRYVKVREFYHYRQHSNARHPWNRSTEKSSVLNSPQCSSIVSEDSHSMTEDVLDIHCDSNSVSYVNRPNENDSAKLPVYRPERTVADQLAACLNTGT